MLLPLDAVQIQVLLCDILWNSPLRGTFWDVVTSCVTHKFYNITTLALTPLLKTQSCQDGPLQRKTPLLSTPCLVCSLHVDVVAAFLSRCGILDTKQCRGVSGECWYCEALITNTFVLGSFEKHLSLLDSWQQTYMIEVVWGLICLHFLLLFSLEALVSNMIRCFASRPMILFLLYFA